MEQFLSFAVLQRSLRSFMYQLALKIWYAPCNFHLATIYRIGNRCGCVGNVNLKENFNKKERTGTIAFFESSSRLPENICVASPPDKIPNIFLKDFFKKTIRFISQGSLKKYKEFQYPTLRTFQYWSFKIKSWVWHRLIGARYRRANQWPK